MNLNNFNVMDWLTTMVILVIAITIHEFAHAMTAYKCGDDTPRLQGRLTVNPVDHLDPLGTLLMALSTATGFGIGWGKPVQYNPGALKHPRWDTLKIAIAGPISNIFLALIFTALVRGNDHFGWLTPGSPGENFLSEGIWINLALVFFNMIPIPPLDGSKVLSSLLPLAQAQAYDRVMGQIGLFLFFGLIFTGATRYVIGPPLRIVYSFLVGG